ncbi:gliding motility-associated ABC transporter ATP-binding subunit GldA [Chitinophaga caeni]|uniref:Gliding motility-associated ABC transporter ATP-binding subunit GldA n=1 Tax=Chitinophaga caeni TaxID=2029983 RepID=A0A291QQU0_9BACT|nr:gliding motility-associated ABC transporter ATP-binding subunit GldA [Chitinophaga caeni]ATL46204.1 gliding motility-associated ABC transporter ATP-binding subunit GldA [Chitinophaga caeni]
MSIEVVQLTKLYGEQKAIDNISFSLQKGEIAGFLGPNGAGKSTTMKILSGYLPPSHGSAKVDGLDVAAQSMEVRKRVGYLPESNPLYYDMYVKEFLGFIADMHQLGSRKKQRIDEMIGMTGLGAEQHKKIGALSKGYKQRVGLAQALMHDPSVLILDEPTSGLDPNQLAEIRNLIKSLGQNKTVMLSTHIMQEVEALCGKVIIINKGHIIADDNINNLRNRQNKGGYLVVSFGDPVKREELMAIDGVSDVAVFQGQGWQIFAGDIDSVKKNLMQFALINNRNILSLQSNSTSLEDIFRDITK